MSFANVDNLLDDENLPWEDATDDLSSALEALSLKASSPVTTKSPLKTTSPFKAASNKPTTPLGVLKKGNRLGFSSHLRSLACA